MSSTLAFSLGPSLSLIQSSKRSWPFSANGVFRPLHYLGQGLRIPDFSVEMEERKGSFAMCLDQMTELYGILSCSDRKSA